MSLKDKYHKTKFRNERTRDYNLQRLQRMFKNLKELSFKIQEYNKSHPEEETNIVEFKPLVQIEFNILP